MKKVFEAPQQVAPLIASPKIRKVLHMSVEASQKIIAILESLQEQGLLGKSAGLRIWMKLTYLGNLYSLGSRRVVCVDHGSYRHSLCRSHLA